MFNPARLTTARLRRKLTKKALAEALGFEEKTIRRYEVEGFIPPVDTLELIAKILDFPMSFFLQDADLDDLPVEAASFRSLKAMPAKDRDAALAAGSIAFAFDDWISDRFGLPEQKLLDLKEDTEAETAAQALRRKWALGDRPINNLIHYMEAHGIRVFSLCENTKNVDAFSLWRRDIPYVFLNTFKTAERSRFDAAHEIGHLILHKHGGPNGSGFDAETHANNFASSLLMPRASVLAKIPNVRSLNQIIHAKSYWGVSASALIYRLNKLKLISAWQYRTFNIQLSQNHGSSEPAGMKREQSSIWEKVLKELRQSGITKHNIAANLHLPVSEIEDMVFGLSTMQSIDGAGVGSGKGRAALRLVE